MGGESSGIPFLLTDTWRMRELWLIPATTTALWCEGFGTQGGWMPYRCVLLHTLDVPNVETESSPVQPTCGANVFVMYIVDIGQYRI